MHIFFSGIGGVGIGPLARIAHDAQYIVSGSDQQASPMTSQLAAQGVLITFEQTSDAINAIHKKTPIDWFVYTAALPSDHPELRFAQKNGIKISKRDELLAHIIKDKNLQLIAIAGTHGKTTTSAMLTWLFKQLNIPVSYSVGAAISFGTSGSYDPKSSHFVYECDEFDRNFLHFSPEYTAITSYDYDHPDTYPTKHDYRDAFLQFVNQSRNTVMFHSSAVAIFTDRAISRVIKIVDDSDSSLASIKLAGQHNRKNALLAILLFEKVFGQKYSRSELIEVINHFPGSSRRFEQVAPAIYSDYAHHPTEIEATLQLARELSDNVVVIYQPHQNTRQYDIQPLYNNCFAQASKVYWLPTYLSREDSTLAVLSVAELSKNVTTPVIPSELNNKLWQCILEEKQEGALIVCMGAGDIDPWIRKNAQPSSRQRKTA